MLQNLSSAAVVIGLLRVIYATGQVNTLFTFPHNKFAYIKGRAYLEKQEKLPTFINIKSYGPYSNPHHTFRMVKELDSFCVEGKIIGVLEIQKLEILTDEVHVLFKKWIRFLEGSWNHEYFGSLAK